MRHRKAGFKLGRTTAHRLSTVRNIAAGLFEHGQVTTTIPRAKLVQPFVEKIVTLAKRGDIHSRRLVAARLGRDRKAFDWLYINKYATEEERDIVRRTRERAEVFFNIPDSSTVERDTYGEIRKSPRIVKHIFENIAPKYRDRPGGYTRIVKLGKRRIGDAGELCVIQFVGSEEGPEIGGNISTRRRIADKRTAYAAELRKKFGQPKGE
ncbi:MAG TPA: 50S ribosomal protein L17 [Phycisphaerales bacterium]|nr:50S ribosomal protein L17 [Phycisphaerales bacterium]